MINTNLPAGLLILSEAFNTFKLKEMTVTKNALREGIIIDTIMKMKEMQDMTV